MKIKIESDVFDIVQRVKDIDEGYFIMYNDITNKFEIHNINQNNSYCFASKYCTIDKRLIDEILQSQVCNIDNILNEIDINNYKIEQEAYDKIKNDSDYMLREIYKYSTNSSKDYNEDVAFSTIWR